MVRLRGRVRRQRWSLAQFVAQSFALLLVVAAGLFVPAAFVGDGAAAADREPVSFEVGYLRSAFSSTFAQPDGSMKTVVSLVPVHYQDAKGDWREIKSRLVASERDGYAWRNEEAGFKADLRGQAGEGLVRFESGGARFTLTPEGAAARPVERTPTGEALAYKGVFDGVDLEYQLLATGVKETLVLADASAPALYRFRVVPVAGSEFELVARADGGLDVRTPASALPVAVISAPTVSDSRRITVEDRTDSKQRKEAIVDSLPAPGKASMSAKRESDGSYLLTLSIDQKWLSDPERLFPVKLDPTVTTTVSVQDAYWHMDCSGGSCTPTTTGSTLVVSKDGTGTSGSGNGPFSNGTLRDTSAIVFSMGEIPTGASVTSTQLQLYQTSCFVGSAPGSCNYWWPEDGEGQSGDVEVRRFSSGWGPATTASGAASAINSTVLASRYFSMVESQQGADHTNEWRTWSGSSLTSWVQDVVNGSLPNYGLALSLDTEFFGWGPIFASSEYSDPSKAPKLEVQWVADGVQLNPSTNIHSDGPELTWTRFAAGYGAYTSAVLTDQPRAYWRMNDASGSPFGIADWSGNSLHSTPTAR